ncbi:MAG: ABC transporter ATP-binding protein [Sporolactobacillus sp.]
MSESIIQATNLNKRYGKKQAIDQLTVQIARGSVTALLGANGAGKSTFFRMVTGLVAPDSGELTVLGGVPGWQTNRQIAYLPDRARWYKSYTTETALRYGEQFLPGFDQKQAEQMAKHMRLPLDMPVHGMSKGQEARLMLILCICRDVPLIILDEPFSGIDGASRAAIMDGLIDAISERQQTLLLSTHEIAEAEGLFDDVIFLSDGHVRFSGSAEDLRAEFGSVDRLARQLSEEDPL